jgi:hypothetical protein
MESIAIAEELQEMQERNAGNLAAKGTAAYEESTRRIAPSGSPTTPTTPYGTTIS